MNNMEIFLPTDTHCAHVVSSCMYGTYNTQTKIEIEMQTYFNVFINGGWYINTAH